MQHPPIIKHHRPPRLQLNFNLKLPHPQHLHPLPRRRVPLLHGLSALPRRRDRSIIIIPPHPPQIPRRAGSHAPVVLQDREAAGVRSGVVDTPDGRVAARMRDDLLLAQCPVRALILTVQILSGREAVDEGRCAAGAVRVREQMEHLQAAGVGEVGRVGVDGEGEGRVGCVGGIGGGGEVPKGAIVGGADEGDAGEEGFGGGGRDGAGGHEGEAELVDLVEPAGEAGGGGGGHDGGVGGRGEGGGGLDVRPVVGWSRSSEG